MTRKKQAEIDAKQMSEWEQERLYVAFRAGANLRGRVPYPNATPIQREKFLRSDFADWLAAQERKEGEHLDRGEVERD